jgi:hypothetical protein
MTTLRTLPASELMKYADRLYEDLHLAYQVRQRAARQIQEG